MCVVFIFISICVGFYSLLSYKVFCCEAIFFCYFVLLFFFAIFFCYHFWCFCCHLCLISVVTIHHVGHLFIISMHFVMTTSVMSYAFLFFCFRNSISERNLRAYASDGEIHCWALLPLCIQHTAIQANITILIQTSAHALFLSASGCVSTT